MNDIVKKIYAQMLSDENRLLNGAMTAEEYRDKQKQLDAMPSAKDLYDDTPKDFLR